MSQAPFTIERLLSAPVEKVWKALTDKDQMKQWYFDVSDFKPENGFEFRFSAKDGETEFIHLCKIKEVIQQRKLSYTWKYEGYQGNSTVTFELFPEGDKTRLRLTHEGLDTFPSNNKSFARESFARGWTHIIGSSLPGYLEKTR